MYDFKFYYACIDVLGANTTSCCWLNFGNIWFSFWPPHSEECSSGVTELTPLCATFVLITNFEESSPVPKVGIFSFFLLGGWGGQVFPSILWYNSRQFFPKKSTKLFEFTLGKNINIFFSKKIVFTRYYWVELTPLLEPTIQSSSSSSSMTVEKLVFFLVQSNWWFDYLLILTFSKTQG